MLAVVPLRVRFTKVPAVLELSRTASREALAMMRSLPKNLELLVAAKPSVEDVRVALRMVVFRVFTKKKAVPLVPLMVSDSIVVSARELSRIPVPAE